MRYDIWDERVGYDPTLEAVVTRYDDVWAAFQRFWQAGLKPKAEWFVELGLIESWPPLGRGR